MEQEDVKSQRRKIEVENAIASIVVARFEREMPSRFPSLQLRYGIARDITERYPSIFEGEA